MHTHSNKITDNDMQVRESMTHSAAKRNLPLTQAYFCIYIMKFPPDPIHTSRS